jgi:hypothetical protein
MGASNSLTLDSLNAIMRNWPISIRDSEKEGFSMTLQRMMKKRNRR